jgi:23S rRNA (cytosine1962-C5)-methyltransferase
MSDRWPDYELIDFGEGRKLERFGAWLLDRPASAATGLKKVTSHVWKTATARFLGDRAAAGEWQPKPERWTTRQECSAVSVGDNLSFNLQLESLPSGQIGIFPEQRCCWDWLAQTVQRLKKVSASPDIARSGLNVLNLFAYTGGSTLAAAVGGAEIVHVDAAKSIVARARENAAASGLANRPIRWIVEDAMKFCRREVNRGNRYDAVILDPPTYGHGPKGEEWVIKRDLLPLLELCGELTERCPKFVLLTCHTPGIGPAELSAYLSEGIFGRCGQPPKTGELFLETADGRRLPSGVYARWPG